MYREEPLPLTSPIDLRVLSDWNVVSFATNVACRFSGKMRSSNTFLKAGVPRSTKRRHNRAKFVVSLVDEVVGTVLAMKC